MASAAAAGFTRGDVSLLKFVITAGLYPNLAVAAVGNMHRRFGPYPRHMALCGVVLHCIALYYIALYCM
eukprot:scaffold673866_cov61-Prasinocladus_malaysianus.AAC.1